MSVPDIVSLVAAAAILAGVVWRRGQLGFERAAIGVLIALALVVTATGLLDKLPQPEQVIQDVAKALGVWTYLLVGSLAFLETGAFVGLVAPGEFAVMIGGVVAAQGEIEIVPLIGLVWVCAIAGDSLSFYIGHRLGRRFLEKHGPKVKITAERLDKVEGYFQRYGGRTILIGRFIGLVRALAPFIAGSSKMAYRQFIPYSIVGTGLWASTFCLLGYVFYRSFEKVAGYAGKATLVFGCVVALIVGGVYAYKRLRVRENRVKLMAWFDAQGRRPLLRPVAAVVRPLWRRAIVPAAAWAKRPGRFLWERLTPGHLGLEFTTALAVGAIGTYVFALYAVILSGDTVLTPADGTFLEVAGDLRNQSVTDVVKVATDLGSLPVMAVATLVAAGLLLRARHTAEATTLIVAAAMIYVAVHVAKAAIDRPRPPGAVVDSVGASYPSGHAAYAAMFVWIALMAARVLPGLGRRAAIVGGALALTIFVGLSRIYLGAHYWSDVAGGWALGFGILGAVSAIALLVTHLRHNAPDAPAGSRP